MEFAVIAWYTCNDRERLPNGMETVRGSVPSGHQKRSSCAPPTRSAGAASRHCEHAGTVREIEREREWLSGRGRHTCAPLPTRALSCAHRRAPPRVSAETARFSRPDQHTTAQGQIRAGLCLQQCQLIQTMTHLQADAMTFLRACVHSEHTRAFVELEELPLACTPHEHRLSARPPLKHGPDATKLRNADWVVCVCQPS